MSIFRKYNDLQIEHAIYKKWYETQRNTILELQKDLEEAEGRAQAYKRMNDNQQTTIIKMTDSLIELRKELTEEEARANAYKSMGEYKMNAFLREEQKVRNLEAEVESLKKLNKSLSTEYVDFQDLYDKLNGLESERDQAIKEKVRLEVIRDGLLKENQRLKQDRTYLHTELADRAKEIERLKRQVNVLTVLFGSCDVGYEEKRKG